MKVLFLPPEEVQKNIKTLLREKIQNLLEKDDIDKAVEELENEKDSPSLQVLKKIIDKMKEQGLTVAYIIDLLSKMFGG